LEVGAAVKILSAILLFALTALPGDQSKKPQKRHAEAEVIWRGNQLYDLCQHYKTDKFAGGLGPACFMYIAGSTQTLLINDDTDTTMVPPCPGKGVTDEQITDVVIKWMDDHPDKRDLAAPYVVMRSLNDAFPCH
jgi:hypothetical protein